MTLKHTHIAFTLKLSYKTIFGVHLMFCKLDLLRTLTEKNSSIKVVWLTKKSEKFTSQKFYEITFTTLRSVSDNGLNSNA